MAWWRWGLVLAGFVTTATLGCGGGGGSEEDAGGEGDAAQDAATMCESDADCDDGTFCNGAERCAPDDPEAGSDGCAPPDDPEPCLESQTCSEEEGRCLTDCDVTSDADGDGSDSVDCGGDDCDDSDANAFPGNTEVCDEDDHDEDCDPATFGERDEDGDGFFDAACCNVDSGGTMMCGDDCDDGDAAIHPTADESCDEADNDCDGTVDEGVTTTLWPDVDGDMFGDGSVVPVEGCPSLMPDHADNDGDCDDSRPAINPAASEVCDSMDVDEDCDPSTIGDRDADEDGFVSQACCNAQPDGSLLCGPDCDDGDVNIHPDATEVCDDVDDDCDPATFGTRDRDGDGFVAVACCNTQEDGTELCGEDCDDGDTSGDPLCGHPAAAAPENTNPDATELCDGCDNDCSSGGGTNDEDVDQDYHLAEGFSGCSGGDLLTGDCNDLEDRARPNQTSYFDTAYCSDGSSPVGCSGTLTFDYDCDGVEEKEPMGGACDTTCAVGFACGGGGALYDSSDDCGDFILRRSCGGCPCDVSESTSNLRCR